MRKRREAVRHAVDMEQFKAVLKEKNLTFGDVSTACGYSRNWLSNELYYYKGLNNLQLRFLSSEFDISYDDIKPVKRMDIPEKVDNEDIKKDIKEIKAMLEKLLTELGC